MKIQKFFLLFLVLGIGLGIFSTKTHAATPAALVLSQASGDVINVQITGEPNSAIQLYFYPPNSSLPTSIPFGFTNSNGSYSNTFSSGAYGIPPGVQSYIIINGQQSATATWPAYSPTITLSQYSVNLSVGQSVAINSSNIPTASYNSNEAAITKSISNSTVTLTAKATGSGTVTICGTTVGCANITFVVGSTTASAITFSQNNISLTTGQSSAVTIYYERPGNGFFVSANSNPSAVTASISGQSSSISLYGEDTGSATITICSKDNSNVCASLYINTTAGTNTASTISFSQSTVILNYGQNTIITATGDPDNKYFVSSNSNPNIVSVGISGSTISFTGGNTAGTGTIKICSLKTTTVCGDVYVTIATNSSSALVSFTRSDVTLNNGQNVNVTIYGGIGTNYFIYSNSNKDIADVTIANNILSITGKSTIGTTTVRVCSGTVGASCADLPITTTLTPVVITNPITLSQTNISLNPAETTTITITGGSAGKSYIVSSNSNPDAVTAQISNTKITLNAGDTESTSVVSICDSTATTVCANIYVSIKAYTPPLSVSQNRLTLTVGQSATIMGYYSGTTGNGLNVNYISNSELVKIENKGSSSFVVTAGPATGKATIAICSAALASDCVHVYITSVAPAIVPETPATTTTTNTTPQVQGATTTTTSNNGFKFTKQLTTGSTGNDVRQLQIRLTAEKVYSGPITGLFGAQTRAAVKLYQKNHGLSQVGVLGPATRALLNK